MESRLRPEDPQAYYWGSVAPDIRYLAGISRNQTHITTEKICEYMVQYPNLRSFLQGYLVHCLTDQIDLASILYHCFPLNLLKGKLSPKHLVVLLEFFYLENVTLNKKLSGRYNAVLEEMGVNETHVQTFVQVVTKYLSSPSLVTGISLVQQLGILDDSRIEEYFAAAERFQKSWIQKNLLFLSLRIGKISEQITSSVIAMLPSMQSL